MKKEGNATAATEKSLVQKTFSNSSKAGQQPSSTFKSPVSKKEIRKAIKLTEKRLLLCPKWFPPILGNYRYIQNSKISVNT